MPSSFTWLDYSEQERRKMLDAIRLFKDQNTVDELGIGTVRDRFADLLFPGTGTVQTRARYFLFVPWLYLSIERRKLAATAASVKARDEELNLIDVLAESEDAAGTIGVRSRRKLNRLPSSIYWQGLGSWGIRLSQGSQDQYHRSLDSFYTSNQRLQLNDDKEPVGPGWQANWHSGIPPAPREFPKQVSLRLAQPEAKYLRERILANAQRSLLAFLVDRGQITEDTDFPWEHPQFQQFPTAVQSQLAHARNFSEVIHGAALLYNLMLAEAKRNDELEKEYADRLAAWSENIATRRTWLLKWDRDRFWELVAAGNQRVPHLTQVFISRWTDLVLSLRAPEIEAHQSARQMVQERERQLKKSLARLNNQRSLELWNGEAGTRQLDYRWAVSQTIIRDILEALANA
jgi:hypothetical protein